MTEWHPASEGYVKVQGLWLFYMTFGEDGKKGTVLGVHGGPGGTHDSLLPLSDLAKFGYKVVLYDQMGCGRSEIPSNKAILTVERHMKEVDGIRRELDLEKKIHFLGESWGGMLGLNYAIESQTNLKSLIVCSGSASSRDYLAGVEKLRSKLPKRILETLKKYEAQGDYGNPGYLSAVEEFNNRHLVRLSERPPELVLPGRDYLKNQSHSVMWGPIKFACTGVLRYWDVSDKIHKIRVPTLITSSKYDEVIPEVALGLHRKIKNSKLVVFPQGAHQIMWDERERFMKAIRTFLADVQ